jgi:hypothetical protein
MADLGRQPFSAVNMQLPLFASIARACTLSLCDNTSFFRTEINVSKHISAKTFLDNIFLHKFWMTFHPETTFINL